MIYNLYENYQSTDPTSIHTQPTSIHTHSHIHEVGTGAATGVVAGAAAGAAADTPTTCEDIHDGKFDLPLLYGSVENEGCFLDDKFFTTYNFTQLRDTNLQKYDIVYAKIMNGETEYNDNEKHTKILCLMEEMFSDIKKVNKYNKEKKAEIDESKTNKKSNSTLIKEHKEKLEKHENYNLIKQNRIINTENKFYKKKLEYNIYFWFILIFIIIQLILLIIIL